MRTSKKVFLPFVLAAAALPLTACSDDDSDAVKKDVDALRTDVQKTQRENDKLKSQLATAEGRINGLAEDLAHVRQISVDVKAAPAPEGGVAATDAGTAGTQPAAAGAPGIAAFLSTPEGAAIKSYFATDDGKKVLEDAIQNDREARARETSKRQVDSLVDRFAKQNGLTDDQTRRMKDILEKKADSSRDIWTAMRDLPPEASQEQRDDLRKQLTTKTDELRKSSDDQLRGVLSTTQYESYQKEEDKVRQGARAVGAGARRGNGGRPNNNGNNGNGNN